MSLCTFGFSSIHLFCGRITHQDNPLCPPSFFIHLFCGQATVKRWHIRTDDKQQLKDGTSGQMTDHSFVRFFVFHPSTFSVEGLHIKIIRCALLRFSSTFSVDKQQLKDGTSGQMTDHSIVRFFVH